MPDDAPRSTMLRETAPEDQAVGYVAQYRWGEKELRQAVEDWLRARYPDARICHELVLSRGDIRLDVIAVRPDRLIIVELKSWSDSMQRGIHQIGMACLCADEAWLITDGKHRDDMDMLRWLLPGFGIAVGVPDGPKSPDMAHSWRGATASRIEVHEEWAREIPPHAKAQLSVLWADELRDEARRHRVACTARSTVSYLVAEMARLLTADEIRRAVCRQLRRRKALWRADPPIFDPAETVPSGEAAA